MAFFYVVSKLYLSILINLCSVLVLITDLFLQSTSLCFVDTRLKLVNCVFLNINGGLSTINYLRVGKSFCMNWPLNHFEFVILFLSFVKKEKKLQFLFQNITILGK